MANWFIHKGAEIVRDLIDAGSSDDPTAVYEAVDDAVNSMGFEQQVKILAQYDDLLYNPVDPDEIQQITVGSVLYMAIFDKLLEEVMNELDFQR